MDRFEDSFLQMFFFHMSLPRDLPCRVCLCNCVTYVQIAGIRDQLTAGKNWAIIANNQERSLKNDKLDSNRVQGLLDTFGVLVEREDTIHEQASRHFK